MGQFTLGLRSLLIKSAVFVVMAALLAWALGGTLWPKPTRAEFHTEFFQGHNWYWRVIVYREREPDEDEKTSRIRWELIWKDEEMKTHVLDNARWIDRAGPIRAYNYLYFGGVDEALGPANNAWIVAVVDRNNQIIERHPMPDRLAVEQQLARVAAGLPLQTEETILGQRQAVLDPPALDSPQ